MLPALWKRAVTYGVAVAKKRRSGVTYATPCAKYFLDKKIKCSNLQSERCEAGIAVVKILIFCPLQRADDLVGKRRENDLHSNLEDELRQHDRWKLLVRDDSGPIEGERIEKRRVDRFASDGRADG